MAEPVLSLQNVTKSYGAFRLGPVNLALDPGYVVALVGPNGSGKSTLFRMLMNLVHPDQGEIQVFGCRYPDDEIRIKSRIGYVPERSVGHDWMDVDALGDFYARWYASWNSARYEASLQAMHVDRGTPFGKLSKGIQRRVMFGLAMATNPELLLCDEPTDGVDPFARQDMLADISRYMQEGERSVFLATHNMDEVRRMADYVAFLVDGVFLGLFEKDSLLETWRRLWLDRVPEAATPGIVRIHEGDPTEVVSSNWRETAQALDVQGVVRMRSAPLDLTEILGYLMKRQTAELAGEERSIVHIR